MLKSLWLLGFILKTYSEKIFANLNNRGIAATFLRRLKNLKNGEIFFCLEIAEIDRGSILGWKERAWT